MKVYIYQGYFPAGGTYMTYHIGRILNQYFGCEVYSVGDRPANSMFDYPVELPTVTEPEFLQMCGVNDLFLCNPSFSSQQFGLRLPCRKLSYIQGIRTFAVLDVFFDHYVFVSEWARRFISAHYGKNGNIIPAFVTANFFAPQVQPDWRQRNPVFLISQRKFDDVQFQRLVQTYKRKFSGNAFPYEVVPILPQSELAERFRGSQYYLSLDTMEGFGLPMLEAMASGCAIAGWDSGGNQEYARHGDNAMLARYGDFETLADHIHFLLNNDFEAGMIAWAGKLAAQPFDSQHFDLAWARELSLFLKRPFNLSLAK